MLIKSATDMSGIITRELTMGIISLVLIFVSIAAVLLYFKQQLKDRKKDCREILCLFAHCARLPTSGRPSCIGCIQQTSVRAGHCIGSTRSADVYRSRNCIGANCQNISEYKIKHLCEAETALNYALKKIANCCQRPFETVS